MKKSTLTRRRNKIEKETIESMKELGTYKKEFAASLRRYAEMRIQYDELNLQWYESGCVITEDFINKSGAKNKKKTTLYSSIESLRKELIEMENIFGLTPKGLKQIKANGLNTVRKSKLDEVLGG